MAAQGGDPQTAGMEDLKTEFPDWHFWAGVAGGLLYARRPQTSPPRVVRAADVQGLREAIRAS